MTVREQRIDIIKGITIVLMVLGHSGFAGKKFIYLFHMAVFFMVSGYLFKPNYEGRIRGISVYILKKVKSIWLPYFIWNAVYTLLNNVLIKWNIYSATTFEVADTVVNKHPYMSFAEMAKNIVKGIAMVGRTELGGAFWFLRTLFALTILFCIADYILNCLFKKEIVKDVIHLVISVGFLGCGYITHLMGIKAISVSVVLSSYILYFGGYMIKKYKLMSCIPKAVGIIAGVVVLLLCYFGPGISIGDNSYGNPLYLLICSAAGWVLVYEIARIWEEIGGTRIIAYIGQKTMAIVIHHFWCFKLVHCIQIAVYGYPIKSLAAFPNLKCDHGWWLAYLTAGVLLPILLNFVWEKPVRLLHNRQKCK